MKNAQQLSDKMAIGLSLVCAIHCLALPLLALFLPTLFTWEFDGEQLHLWILLAVIPTSVYALTMGCKQHKNYKLWFWGGIGIATLLVAFISGESTLGEWGEKLLTTLGAGFVAFGHIQNYRLCQKEEQCDCTEKNQTSL